ncbi:N-acetylneuraminate synthase family protein [Pontivivens insulae]|uniref:N,N'-diacetyllegionaminic acid synthase n=1 Tax=Pontivivens insulae TaxID=1639689 RepID=A0A2R8A7H7_9RHOB|nr:N-acetylneuraminate synthase family protein [Pontivivens insulae]RED18291.1 N-acetylneuraminate synthase [Pontivivens insulae]SPF28189.1 N,N'-diacetyllegionaminic acid synthase [Pontivivens insulae]
MDLTINGAPIGPGHDPFIILEVGINHNGEMDRAREMIRSARDAGADAVKFQTFQAARFIKDDTAMFTYVSQGKEVTESQMALFSRHEFTPAQWAELKTTCDDEGIVFMSTPQDRDDLAILLDVGVPALKIGSDDFTNTPLVHHYAQTGLPLILSCGMANLAEVYESLTASGALDGGEVALLLCTSQYPTPPEDVNLAKLKTLQGAFPGLVVGLSDHTRGSVAAAAAVALGASIFEKHFTLDRNLPGPDHWFSEDPADARRWVETIRTAHRMLGSSRVAPTSAERDMKPLARRSITAMVDIAEGEAFTPSNVDLQRPGTGLPARNLADFHGQAARRAIKANEQLSFSDIA